MSTKTATNPLAGLVTRKGAAAPTRPAEASPAPAAAPAPVAAAVEPIAAPAAAPAVVAAPMASAARQEAPAAKPTALTVKLDGERYRQLRLLGVETNRKHQDLLVTAVDLLLQARARGEL